MFPPSAPTVGQSHRVSLATCRPGVVNVSQSSSGSRTGLLTPDWWPCRCTGLPRRIANSSRDVAQGHRPMGLNRREQARLPCRSIQQSQNLKTERVLCLNHIVSPHAERPRICRSQLMAAGYPTGRILRSERGSSRSTWLAILATEPRVSIRRLKTSRDTHGRWPERFPGSDHIQVHMHGSPSWHVARPIDCSAGWVESALT